MKGYAAVVMILHFVVELLLLLGADRLYPRPVRWGRMMLGAGVGGVYAGACLLSRFAFLTGCLWHFLCLGIIAVIAYGVSVSAMRRGAVFLLLNMALDGISSGFSRESIWHLLLMAVIAVMIGFIGFRGRGGRDYVPVEITHGGKTLHMTALRDTGNTLTDPVTGRAVLIVGADAARQLTGLTKQQLRTPLESMVTAGVPGLRLIPYHTVGQSTCFMLGLQMQRIKIGNRIGSYLVAFAPEGLNREGTFQALTGGVV